MPKVRADEARPSVPVLSPPSTREHAIFRAVPKPPPRLKISRARVVVDNAGVTSATQRRGFVPLLVALPHRPVRPWTREGGFALGKNSQWPAAKIEVCIVEKRSRSFDASADAASGTTPSILARSSLRTETADCS